MNMPQFSRLDKAGCGLEQKRKKINSCKFRANSLKNRQRAIIQGTKRAKEPNFSAENRQPLLGSEPRFSPPGPPGSQVDLQNRQFSAISPVNGVLTLVRKLFTGYEAILKKESESRIASYTQYGL